MARERQEGMGYEDFLRTSWDLGPPKSLVTDFELQHVTIRPLAIGRWYRMVFDGVLGTKTQNQTKTCLVCLSMIKKADGDGLSSTSQDKLIYFPSKIMLRSTTETPVNLFKLFELRTNPLCKSWEFQSHLPSGNPTELGKMASLYLFVSVRG